MAQTTEFDNEHNAIAAAITKVKGIMGKDLKVEANARELAANLSGMLTAAVVHFNREKGTMYPKLKQVDAALVARFEKRINDIAAAFQSLVTKYCSPSTITTNAEACKKELNSAFDLVLQLVKDENVQLYPVFRAKC